MNRPTVSEAIHALRDLEQVVTYNDVDATTTEGAEKTLARWGVFAMALDAIETELEKGKDQIRRRNMQIKTLKQGVNRYEKFLLDNGLSVKYEEYL